jgi:putative DNA primase/helicase
MMIGRMALSSKFPWLPANATALSSPMTWMQTITIAYRTWAESKLKTITGGDEVSARFMRQDFFRFTPTFKLMIAGNHKLSDRR